MTGVHNAMRCAIVGQLLDHLREAYGVEALEATTSTEHMKDYELDAFLAFKTDPKLDELRSALGRLEDGSFGTCIVCKLPITQGVLHREPTRRFCPACTRKVRRHSALSTPLQEMTP